MDLLQPPLKQKPIERKFFIEQVDNLKVFHLVGRVDSFNFDQIRDLLKDLVKENPHGFAVNLENTEFLSIPFIKLLAELAETLIAQDSRLALIAPSEKLKRQIDIFASLDEMIIFRSMAHLKGL